MSILLTPRAVLACSLFAASLAAQVASPPPAPPATPTPGMLATDRYLFVVRGDVLYQFDVDSLEVRNTFRFPTGRATPVRVRAGGDAPAAVEVVEVTPSPRAAAPRQPPRPEPSELPEAPSAEVLAAAVDAGVAWLVRYQDDDGRWDADEFMKHDDPALGDTCTGPGNPVHDVGVTGLALLALLADGNTLRSGTHREAVKRAAKWLREQQQHNGLIGTNAAHDFIYGHAIATYALTEAFGLSSYPLLRETAQSGIDYLESHRNPYAVWRYQPRDNDNDTSVTTWAALAYASANHFDLTVNQEALKHAAVWYDQVTSPDGRAGYSKQGEPSSRMPGDYGQRFPVGGGEAMTAAATFARFFLGQTPKEKPILLRSAQVLRDNPPRWTPEKIDAVYWHFGTHAALQLGGDTWDVWRRTHADLVANQCRDGNRAGSWEPIGVWDEAGGRVFVTALYTLSLAAGDRFARRMK
jgi:hypothetical protein